MFAVCALVFAATPCASTLLRFSWVGHNGYDETDSFHGSEGCRGFDTPEACFRTFKRAPFVCSPQPINRECDNVLRWVYVVLLSPFCRCLRPELHKTATLGSQYNEMVRPFACGLRGVFCCLFMFNNNKDSIRSTIKILLLTENQRNNLGNSSPYTRFSTVICKLKPG